jgi:predicted MPP superfamily phosphohydrolase
MQAHLLTRIFFSLLAIAVSAGAHAVVAYWALRFPFFARRRRAVIAVAGALVLLIPVGRWTALLSHTDLASRLFAFVTTETMLVVLSAIPLGLALLMARRAPVNEGRRRVLEAGAGLATLGATTAVFGWGMARGRHAFAIEECVARIPGLPRVLEGYTIAQISDLHVGPFVGDRELREGLARVDEVRPDLLVVTGDLVDFDPRYAPLLAHFLAGVRTRDGIVAIPGNHDYYSGVAAVLGAMRSSGVDVLLNAGKMVRPADGGGFALLGVDDLWAPRSGGKGPDLERALAMVAPDAPRILLAHQPKYIEAAAGNVALQLSGHTHGGQVNPGFSLAGLFTPYVSGRYERRGTTLWVNRGFGVAGPPTRIGAPPEVTKVVLVAA